MWNLVCLKIFNNTDILQMVIFLKLQIVCFKYLHISQNILKKILWKQYFTTLSKWVFFFFWRNWIIFCLNCNSKKMHFFCNKFALALLNLFPSCDCGNDQEHTCLSLDGWSDEVCRPETDIVEESCTRQRKVNYKLHWMIVNVSDNV